jgi:hypothetical protein
LDGLLSRQAIGRGSLLPGGPHRSKQGLLQRSSVMALCGLTPNMNQR